MATRPSFVARQPRVLFTGRFDTFLWNANYPVSADGERFLMVQPLEATSQSPPNVVVDWFAELKRLVPVAASPK